MSEPIVFDDTQARTFRKRVEVLAFRSGDAFQFDKDWGNQEVRSGGWVIVPLSDEDEPLSDIYGCDSDVFSRTYEASPSQRPYRYRKKEFVRAYQPGRPFTVSTVLSDGHVEVKKSTADAFDSWIVQAASGEVYPIDDAEFRRTYTEVLERTNTYRIKSRDEHWVADGTPKRILALDGGGVRGIVSLAFLDRIERVLRARHYDDPEFRLSHYFDLIAGTSTGAIIAACLARGMSVAEVTKLYERLASSVFRRSAFRWGLLRVKYQATQLRTLLRDVFQERTMGSQSIATGLLVVAKRLDTGSTWRMSNNPGSRWFTAGPNDGFFPNEDYLVRSVVRASTAAPSYFKPEYIQISQMGERPHGEFVDGGVSPHNNPAFAALQLVSIRGFGADWALDPDKLLLVSVGTGTANPGVSRSLLAGGHAIKSLFSLMDDCAESVEGILQWLSDSPTARHIDAAMEDLDGDLLAERPLLEYLRYNIHLDSRWLKEELQQDISEKEVKRLAKMDRPKNMKRLQQLATKAAEQQVTEGHFPEGFDLGR